MDGWISLEKRREEKRRLWGGGDSETPGQEWWKPGLSYFFVGLFFTRFFGRGDRLEDNWMCMHRNSLKSDSLPTHHDFAHL